MHQPLAQGFTFPLRVNGAGVAEGEKCGVLRNRPFESRHVAQVHSIQRRRKQRDQLRLVFALGEQQLLQSLRFVGAVELRAFFKHIGVQIEELLVLCSHRELNLVLRYQAIEDPLIFLFAHAFMHRQESKGVVSRTLILCAWISQRLALQVEQSRCRRGSTIFGPPVAVAGRLFDCQQVVAQAMHVLLVHARRHPHVPRRQVAFRVQKPRLLAQLPPRGLQFFLRLLDGARDGRAGPGAHLRVAGVMRARARRCLARFGRCLALAAARSHGALLAAVAGLWGPLRLLLRQHRHRRREEGVEGWTSLSDDRGEERGGDNLHALVSGTRSCVRAWHIHSPAPA